MQTNAIKRFATEARNKLKEGIAAKIRTLGFDTKGNVADEHRPQLMQGGTHWNGQLLPETFYHQWTSLYHRIQQKGISEVYEEAAYTWFNRLCAIRILQKNDLCAPVLDYTDAARTPFIVDEARQGRIPEMNNEMRSRLSDLLDDDTKVTEQFAVLINAWCHDNPIIHSCFGAMADYTELLLPNNILIEGGFVDMLNHTDFITDADYRSPELIGWLYQFYISERKDEVFAKKGKFEADEIPAATQIFTPNWIVKYMVQNTVGRIYLDNNPYETQLQKKWKYLVDTPKISEIREIRNQEEQITDYADSTESVILKYDELTDLRVADLACGSGHILNECFDLLYDLYIAEGYGRGEAIENIFRYNLTGVDLDTRAKQLATFALLLKACQKDNAFADGHCLPNVLDMTGIVPDMNEQELSEACLRFMGGYEDVAGEMLEQDFELLRDADNLGSIMMFNDDEDYLAMLRYHYDDWTEGDIEDCPEDIKVLIPGVRLILALSEKYHALVMNPPYMGGGNMNATLSKYVKEEYEEGKADLATVFVQMMAERTIKHGSYAFIIPPSWMFLSTFEKLRKNIIENNSIQSLLHLSRGVFGADFGASSAVIQNAANKKARGTYFRLVERTFQEFEQSHLRMLFEQTLANHDFKYRFKDYTKEVTELPYSEDGNRIYYPNVSQQDFEKIPGIRFAFWLSKTIIESFGKNKIKEIACPKAGLSTGDNDRFLRFWFEVTIENIYFDGKCRNDLTSFTEKWVPMTKGGSFRKWYGNNEYILNFQNDGAELKYWLVNNPNDPSTKSFSRYIRNYDLYCKSGFSFADVNSGNTNFRFQPTGFIPNARGPFIFSEERCLLGYLNSCIPNIILKALSPTMSYNVGDVGLVPYISVDNISISNLVQQNISISKEDWDAHETSWDFDTNPLLAVDTDTYIDNIHHEIERHEKETGEHLCIDPAAPELDSLEWRMEQYKQKWEHLFMQLHENEEELNRQFIDIYGLQDELTPDVPLDEITILQQGEISIE